MAACALAGVALLPLLVTMGAAADSSASYAVVCDAGSTGTRAYVYSLGGAGRARIQAQQAAKVKPGLSAFGTRPHETVDYLMQLVRDATPLVPPHLRSQTPLFVHATAGMRLIPEEQQQGVYDALFAGLWARQAQDESEVGAVPFLLRRENFATLTGDEEGFFGLLAVNYLKRVIGADLMPDMGKPDLETALIHRNYMNGEPWVIGSLDLGGSSAQISFSTQRGPLTDGYGHTRPLELSDTYASVGCTLICNTSSRVELCQHATFAQLQVRAQLPGPRRRAQQGEGPSVLRITCGGGENASHRLPVLFPSAKLMPIPFKASHRLPVSRASVRLRCCRRFYCQFVLRRSTRRALSLRSSTEQLTSLTGTSLGVVLGAHLPRKRLRNAR
jgi:hypothetical protein